MGDTFRPLHLDKKETKPKQVVGFYAYETIAVVLIDPYHAKRLKEAGCIEVNDKQY